MPHRTFLDVYNFETPSWKDHCGLVWKNRLSSFRGEDLWSLTICFYREVRPWTMTLTLKICVLFIKLWKTLSQWSLWHSMNKFRQMVSEEKIFEIFLYANMEKFDLGLWPRPWRYDLDLYNFERPLPKDHCGVVWTNSTKWLQRRRSLKFYYMCI